MRLRVVLWLWKGWRPVYTWRHVNAMVRMLRPNLPKGARIICISDQPQTVWHPAECEVYPLWPNPVPHVPGRVDRTPNCYTRLKLFDVEAQAALGIAPGDIVWSKDLDSVVTGQLRSAIAAMTSPGDDDGPDCSDWPSFAAMGGLAARIHGSSFAFRAGTHQHVWGLFNPKLSPAQMAVPPGDGSHKPIGSDQAWMTRNVTGEHLWTEADGFYSWNRHGICMSPARTANAVYWSFAGPVKPWSDLTKQIRPDLHAAYMAAYGER